MLPRESFIRAITMTWDAKFGTTKVIFDVSMTVCAGLLSLVLVHQVKGIGVGTIIAAFFVGVLAEHQILLQ